MADRGQLPGLRVTHDGDDGPPQRAKCEGKGKHWSGVFAHVCAVPWHRAVQVRVTTVFHAKQQCCFFVQSGSC